METSSMLYLVYIWSNMPFINHYTFILYSQTLSTYIKIFVQICSYTELWGSHLRASFLSPFQLQRVFFATWFSEPLRGNPWTNIGLPGGAPGLIFLTLCLDTGANCKATFRYVVSKMHPTTPWTKQARVQKCILILNPNRPFFTFVSNKPAQVPRSFLNRVGGTPEGITIFRHKNTPDAVTLTVHAFIG